jgi:hypothetical protein
MLWLLPRNRAAGPWAAGYPLAAPGCVAAVYYQRAGAARRARSAARRAAGDMVDNTADGATVDHVNLTSGHGGVNVALGELISRHVACLRSRPPL